MANLLIVDDDVDIRKILSGIAAKAGHRVHVASSAKQARSMLDPSLDLLLVDIDMPGETGIELLMDVRKQDGLDAVPVIFVTAYPERATIFREADHGPVKIVGKPFRAEELLEKIEQMLSPAD